MGAVRAKRYLVRGLVQGVGYRYFARQAADRWGIRGFARNLSGGEVEVHAEGDPDALQSFKQELEQGPGMARVREVLETDIPVSGSYMSFSVRG